MNDNNCFPSLTMNDRDTMQCGRHLEQESVIVFQDNTFYRQQR